MKSRFRCLSKQRVLSQNVLYILHNFCVDFRLASILNNNAEQNNIVNGIPVGQRYGIPAAARRKAKEQIVQNYFS